MMDITEESAPDVSLPIPDDALSADDSLPIPDDALSADDSLLVPGDDLSADGFLHPMPVTSKGRGRPLKQNSKHSRPPRKVGRPRKPGLPRAPKLPVVLMTRSGRKVKQRKSNLTGGNADLDKAFKGSMPSSQKWKSEERYQLLYAIQRHGLEDLKVLINYIPTRTIEELQWEINRIRLIKSLTMKEEEGKAMRKAPIDTMSIISNFEPRAVPAPSSDPAHFVNYQKIYQYLHSLLERRPFILKLSPLESAVIVDLMHDIGYTLRECVTSVPRDLMLWKYDLLTRPVDLNNVVQNRLVLKQALENDNGAFRAYMRSRTGSQRSTDIENHNDVPCFPSISTGKSYTNPAHEKFRHVKPSTSNTMFEIHSAPDRPGTSQRMANVGSTKSPSETGVIQIPGTSREITDKTINGQSRDDVIHSSACSPATVTTRDTSGMDIDQSENGNESQNGIVQHGISGHNSQLSQIETLQYTNLKSVNSDLPEGGSACLQIQEEANITQPRSMIQSVTKTNDSTNVASMSIDRNPSETDKRKSAVAIDESPKKRKKKVEADLEKESSDVDVSNDVVANKKRTKKTCDGAKVKRKNDNMVTVGSQLSQKLYRKLKHSHSLESVPESACIRVPLPPRSRLETTSIDKTTGKFITIVEPDKGTDTYILSGGNKNAKNVAKMSCTEYNIVDEHTLGQSSEPGTSTGDIYNRTASVRSLDADTSTGDIYNRTASVRSLDVDTSTGDIYNRTASVRSSDGGTSNGDIYNGTPSVRSSDADTSTGEIYNRTASVRSLDADTSTGDIYNRTASVRSSDAGTSNGDIYNGTPSVRSSDADTSTGDIYNRTPSVRSLDADTSTGDIYNRTPSVRSLDADTSTGDIYNRTASVRSSDPGTSNGDIYNGTTSVRSSDPGTSSGDIHRGVTSELSSERGNDDIYNGTTLTMSSEPDTSNTDNHTRTASDVTVDVAASETVPSPASTSLPADTSIGNAVENSTTVSLVPSKTVSTSASTSASTRASAKRDAHTTTARHSMTPDGDHDDNASPCPDRKSLIIEKPRLFTLNPFCIPVNILKLNKKWNVTG